MVVRPKLKDELPRHAHPRLPEGSSGVKFVIYLIYAHLFFRFNNDSRRRERVFPENWRE